MGRVGAIVGLPHGEIRSGHAVIVRGIARQVCSDRNRAYDWLRLAICDRNFKVEHHVVLVVAAGIVRRHYEGNDFPVCRGLPLDCFSAYLTPGVRQWVTIGVVGRCEERNRAALVSIGPVLPNSHAGRARLAICRASTACLFTVAATIAAESSAVRRTVRTILVTVTATVTT